MSINPTDDTLDENDETIVIGGAKTSGDASITTVNTASVAIVDDDTLVKTITLDGGAPTASVRTARPRTSR